ncbi:MAG: phosphatidylserine decarboxylase [candidate division Zixibacteria bacterium]|nr:phosphatidylserine decarboxylase [candidate division Zixibacteria bacterium]
MNKKLNITYINRANGMTQVEYPFASGFLYWSYNTILGRLLTTFILSRKFISQLYGWLARQKFSRYFISSFIKQTNLNNKSTVPSLNNYSCFNDFFIREPQNNSRLVDKSTNSLVSPTDGKLLVYTGIGPNNTFLIKRNIFNLRQFLCNDDLAAKFANGVVITIRLCLSDYHQFYFPDSGLPLQFSKVKGKYYAGGSYSFKKPIPFYTENYRTTTVFNSDHFGQIVITEVGAFTVGSIKQKFVPGQRVNKGDKKGRFELGGSTVVMLFAKNSITIDSDLLSNSKNEFETRVHFGEKIAIPKILHQANKKMAVL